VLGENSRQTPGWLTDIYTAVARAALAGRARQARRTCGVPGPAAIAQDGLVVKAHVEEMDRPGPSGGQSVV
jgi:hypothetical protein